MDPDATLGEIRVLVLRILGEVDEVDSDEVIHLAELVQALDEWISKGGFLPAAWRREEEKER